MSTWLVFITSEYTSEQSSRDPNMLSAQSSRVCAGSVNRKVTSLLSAEDTWYQPEVHYNKRRSWQIDKYELVVVDVV